jgi:hypothetical protein
MNLDAMLTGQNGVLAGAIIGIVMALKRSVPWLTESKAGQRLLPIVPLILGAIGGGFGSVIVDPVTMANKIIAGIMVGGAASLGFKMLKTTVFGHGLDDVDPEVETPHEAPKPPKAEG